MIVASDVRTQAVGPSPPNPWVTAVASPRAPLPRDPPPRTLQRFEVVTTFDAISPKVKQLMDKMVEMGFGDFSRHKACEYLEANGHDVEAAVDAILRSCSC